MKSIYIKTGIIVSLTIIALVWGLNFLKGKGMFSNQSYYYVVYDRIDGLAVSNQVLINGFKVGQVSDIHFLPDTSGRLIVEFGIGNEFKLPKKTTAQIFSSDLMGTKSINLIFGKSTEMQSSGDTLIADFEGSLTELVSMQMLPLKNKAEDLMKEMEDAIAIVTYIFNDETKQNVMKSLKHMSSTFKNLETSSSNLDSIVQNGKHQIGNILFNVESITTNFEANNEALTSIMKNLANISDSIAQSNIKTMINDLSLVMSEFNTTMNKINNGQGTVGMLVNNDTLYHNLEDATYSLNRLLEDLRMNPKRYLHFSAIDMGKTIYVDDDREAMKRKDKVVYKIQIEVSNKSIPLIPENFKGYKNVDETLHQGIYIYTYGSRKNVDSARSLLKEVQLNFPDAKIIEIAGGAYKEIK